MMLLDLRKHDAHQLARDRVAHGGAAEIAPSSAWGK